MIRFYFRPENKKQMKRVLIPTDFTVESLQLIEYAVLNFPKTPLEVILVSGFKLPDTRWGITHFSEKREINKFTTESFAKAKQTFIREHSDTIGNVHVRLFTGYNSLAFQNFSEQLQAHDAIVPKGKFLHYSNANSFDPTRYIRKNVTNVIEIPLETSRVVQKSKFSISGLLNL